MQSDNKQHCRDILQFVLQCTLFNKQHCRDILQFVLQCTLFIYELYNTDVYTLYM